MTKSISEEYGTFDQEINDFFHDPLHVSSLFNTCLYQGKDIIKPEELTVTNPKIKAYTRDVLMIWDGIYGIYYLGIENQWIENYPMPYRILQYDLPGLYESDQKNRKRTCPKERSKKQ